LKRKFFDIEGIILHLTRLIEKGTNQQFSEEI